MTQFNDVSQDSLVAELNYRREQLAPTNSSNRSRIRRVRTRRHRTRHAA